jgi:F-type H+-transporting ATPase subunit delta
MSLDIKVVKNYAHSLFIQAKKESKENELFKSIKLFAEILRDFSMVNDMLCSPIIDMSSKRNVVDSLTNKLKLEALLKQVLYVLIKNVRMNLFSKIADEYELLLMESRGIKFVQVSSASKLSKKEIEFIQDMLESELSKKVELEHSVDESLLGGVVIKYESNLLDCSVQGALDRIQKAAARS